MEQDLSGIPSQSETPKSPQRPSKFASLIRTLPLAVALSVTTPSPIEAASNQLVSQLVETKSNNIPEVDELIKQKTEEMQDRYHIVLGGKWELQQLSVLDKALSKMPDSLIQTHPAKLALFNTDDVIERNAFCYCVHYVDPKYRPGNYKVSIGSAFLKDQELADIVIFHELIHAKSLIYDLYNPAIEEWEKSLWFQNHLEEALGMPYKDFSSLAKIRLKSNYGNLYNYMRNLYAGYPSEYDRQHNPINVIDMIFSKKYAKLSKVSRWMYAIGSLPGQVDQSRELPIEFVGVMGEWYRGGKGSFLEKTKGVLSPAQSEKVYYFMRQEFFEGYEYNSNGSIKVKPEKVIETNFGTGKKQ